jgi:hypothetical protein
MSTVDVDARPWYNRAQFATEDRNLLARGRTRSYDRRLKEQPQIHVCRLCSDNRTEGSRRRELAYASPNQSSFDSLAYPESAR